MTPVSTMFVTFGSIDVRSATMAAIFSFSTTT
jgi:hypothetical protein